MSADSVAQGVAQNLAFACGEAGPFIAAGISLLFGVFGSGGTPAVTAQQVQDMLNNAVTEMESYENVEHVQQVFADVTTFIGALQKQMLPSPTVQTWEDTVDALRDQFSYANFVVEADLRTLLNGNYLAAGTYVAFDQDVVLKAIVAAVSAQIAAAKSIYLSAEQVYRTIGPTASQTGSSSRADDATAQKYMKYGIDEITNLASLLFGNAGDTPWAKQPVGSALPVWGTLQQGQWLEAEDDSTVPAFLTVGPDGSLKVYAGDSPEDMTGLLWSSAGNPDGTLGASYLVLQSDGNLCVYDLSAPGSSVGAGHGPLIWQSGPNAISSAATLVLDSVRAQLVVQDSAGNPPAVTDVWQENLWPPPPDVPPPLSPGGIIVPYPDQPHPTLEPLGSAPSWDGQPLPPRPSTFWPAIPDISLLLVQWPQLVTTLQPQLAAKLADPNLAVLGGDVAGFADALGWVNTLQQLLAFRLLTRLVALSPVTAYQGREEGSVGGPGGPYDGYVGADGFQFTDAVDPSVNCKIDDDYEDDFHEDPSATHEDEVNAAWLVANGKMQMELNDPAAWQTYYDIADDWRDKFRELLASVVDDAPIGGTLSVASWTPGEAPATSMWGMADTVSYAVSYQRPYKDDMSLRGAWSQPVEVTGTSPVVTGFAGLGVPDDATQVVLWRQVTPKDGVTVNEAFQTPQIVVSDLDWPSTSTYTDMVSAPPMK